MRIISGLKRAERCNNQPLPAPRSVAAKQGLRFERNVVKALNQTGAKTVHNPWFYFEDKLGPGFCCPDILFYHTYLHCGGTYSYIFILECKLTYKPEALDKLEKLYLPVISFALNLEPRYIFPLVIAKNLIYGAPLPALTLNGALCQDKKLLHWLGRGEFPLA